MKPSGYNPIDWNCIIRGCFNYHRHFDIEHFAQCFPSKIGFTDIDAFVELNEHFLIVEFKHAGNQFEKGADLKDGQRRAFEALSKLSDRLTVIVARCNYTSSEITEFCVIKGGRTSKWRACDLDAFTAHVTDWAHRVAPERMSA